MTLKLYDLAGADLQRRFSPYCWRIRLALAHKGLAVETIPWRFVDKAAIAPSGEGKAPALRAGLAPLRATLGDQPYFGGERPMYADYALFGPFQWARCISPFQILAADDPVAAWRGRMLDLFGGLARSAPGYDLPE